MTNSNDTYGYVAYTITPWTLDALSSQKCSGTPIEDTVWVEPVPVVTTTPPKDTICSGDATDILLTTITTSTNGVEFNYTSTASDASIGGNGSGTLTSGQSITETLTNTDDTYGYVAYTITPWTLNASGGQKCSGTQIEDTVWLEPVPVVTATPAKDTICSGDATGILLTTVTTSTNGVEFNYTSTASDASIGGNGTGTLIPGQSITETLTNSDDTYGYVAYTITPWTLDASGGQKCSGAPIEDTVWVEPVPVVTATPAKDTICSGAATNILLNTVTSSLNGVEFTYTSTTSDASIGGNGSGTLSPGQSIIETLTNSDDTYGYVAYTITPWTLDASGGQKCSGTPIEDTVWVEPVPVVTATPAKDTICSGAATSIMLNTVTTSTNGLEFTYTSTASDASIGGNGSGTRTPGQSITETLTNSDDTYGYVAYTITPWTLDASGGQKCSGTPIEDTVWVEPVVQVTLTPKFDTICDGDNVAITLTSPSNPTREVRFKYIHIPVTGVTVTPGASGDLSPNDIITDQVENSTDQAQLIQFIITPYTRGATGDAEKCAGQNDTAFIWVEPTARVTLTPKYDTICNGNNVSIFLDSPSIPTREVRFRYTIINSDPDSVIILPGTGANNLPPGYVISDYIENTSDTAKLIRFIVTPYTRNAGDDGEKCTGINDTAYVWVEPTAVVRVIPENDTICDGENTSIILSTKSVPTSYTRFGYEVEAPAGVTVTINGPQNGLPHGYVIADKIDNATDSAQLVEFIVTPYHEDGEDESVRCPGVPDTAHIWVEPTARVVPVPKYDTICNEDFVSITLTSPTVPTRQVRFRYTHIPVPGVTVAPGAGLDLSPGYTITDQIFNTTDAAQLVQFIITPYTRNAGNDLEKCTGTNDTAFIWVEPTSRVTLTPASDTVCDGEEVSIFLNSPSIPSREVRFVYSTVAPFGVMVNPGSGFNLSPGDEITDQIINTTDSAQEVLFIVTPYDRNPGDDNVKCTGIPDTARIFVEPTARVTLTPFNDTICNEDSLNITLTSPTVPTREVRFRYTYEPVPGVTVIPGSGNDLATGFTITDQIINTNNAAQLVKFVITPYTRHATGIEEKCTGKSDTAFIWVEPTASVILTPGTDTICNEENVSILLTSQSTPTRTVRFRYTHIPVAGVTVIPGTGNDLPPNHVIDDQIINTTDSAQPVLFIVTPYTRNPGDDGEKCSGVSDTAIVWVEPTVRVVLTPPGDTICDGDYTNITLTSPSIPTREVRFKYTYIAPPGVTVNPGPDTTNLPPDFVIADQIINVTDNALEVWFIITPYTRKAHNDEEKCTGIADTAHIWVEPTARVIITPDADTLCNEQYASIQVTIPTVSTNGVRYRFDVDAPSGVYVDPVPNNDLVSGTSIIDSISNTTLNAQQVLFIITPYTWDNNGNEKCPGTADTTVIWINPTPVISVSLPPGPYDTLFCNDSEVPFSVTTDNGFIIGDKVYDITAVIDPDISGATTGSGFENDGTGFTDILNNAHDSIVQKVTYTIIPRFVNVATDIFDCVDGIDTTITVYVAAAMQDHLTSDSLGAYIGGHDLRCFGDIDASITLDRWGGFGSFLGTGYQYDWEARPGIIPGQRNQAGLGANTYPVAISDAVGCITNDTIALTEPELFQIRIDNIIEDPCEGGNKGAIESTPLGGVAGYDYTWNGPFGMIRYDQDIYNLPGGDWDLDAYDTNGCYRPLHVLIPIASGMLVNHTVSLYGSLEQPYNLACNSDSSGWIWIEYVLDGNGDPEDYTYEWIHDGSSVFTGYQDTLNQLEAGDYTLVITDTVSCRDSTHITLIEPPAIEILSENLSEYGGSQIYNIRCHGANDGSIAIQDNEIERLGRNHEYSWTGPGGPTANPDEKDQDSLAAGTYTVVITDQGKNWNCTHTDSFTLIQPPRIGLVETISDYNGFEITCADSSSGWIKVDVTGGYFHPADPYVYEWMRLPDIPIGANADSVAGLSAGAYQVRITDSLNCSWDTSFTMNEPTHLEVNWTPLDRNGVNVSCYNYSDGEIASTTVTGGIESLPYSYYWTRYDNPGWNSIEQRPTGLVADRYVLLVTDANGCQESHEGDVTEPDSLIIGSIHTKRPSCNGASNGSVWIDDITGGTQPYAYLWTPGEFTEREYPGLPQGYYHVDVTDLNGCTAERDTIIGEPEQLMVSIDTISAGMYHGQMIKCYGDENAVLGSIMNGGTRPYNFQWFYFEQGWNLFSTDSVVYNRPTGRHRVIMTDINDCVDTTEIVVTQPEPLTSQSYVEPVKCYGENTGRIDLHMAGGTPGYRYWWTNGDTVPNITELESGEYYMISQDNNYCTYDTTIFVPQPDSLKANLTFENPSCPDDYDGWVRVEPEGGTEYYAIQWAGPGYAMGNTSPLVNDLGPGVYRVLVQDANYCEVTDTAILVTNALTCLNIPTAFTPNADGYNDWWEIQGLEYYPDATIQIFNRWGEKIFYSEHYLDQPFDGTYRGVKLPVDSYHFIIELKNGMPPITGNVTILK